MKNLLYTNTNWWLLWGIASPILLLSAIIIRFGKNQFLWSFGFRGNIKYESK